MHNVKSEEDLVRLIGTLIDELKTNPNSWENRALPSYLDAMRSWVEDMEGYYINSRIELPGDIAWSIFADIIVAAKMYE